jgi:Flp pilus assembly protein TadG
VAHRRDQRGQTELVIIFPVAMLLILLLLQAALWFLGRSVATAAAQDGARAAALVGGSPATATQAARRDLAQLAGPMLGSTAVRAAEGAGRATVTVTGRAQSIIPGFSLAVTATATQPLERFRVDPPGFTNSEASSGPNPSAGSG